MDKYDGATEVKVNLRGKLQIKDPRFGLPTPNDLIYIDESPNYCVPNPVFGSLGESYVFIPINISFLAFPFWCDDNTFNITHDNIYHK